MLVRTSVSGHYKFGIDVEIALEESLKIVYGHEHRIYRQFGKFFTQLERK